MDSILDAYLPSDTKIDFITMDLEGLELSILKSFDFKKYAPDYFLIEDFTPLDFAFKSEVYTLLNMNGYLPVARTKRTTLFQRHSNEN